MTETDRQRHIISPMKVWLRPRHYARKLEDAFERQAQDAKRFSHLDSIIESQRRDAAVLSTEKIQLATRLSERDYEISTLRIELKETRMQLSEIGDVDARMKEVEETLTRFEMMKKRYEKRIEDLEMRLRDTKETLRVLTGEDPENELSIIDMASSSPSPLPSSHPSSHPSSPLSAEPRSWSRERHLCRSPLPAPSATESSESSESPEESNQLDWFRTLPDNII